MLKYPGLSHEEVEERRKAGQDNRATKAPSKSVGKIIFDNVFTYFNGVFAAIAVILISVKSYRDLTFLGVILANTLIGIVQELRAKKILDRLSVLNVQKARVLRDSHLKTIPIDELVLDDVVKFSAGDQIPADAEVLDGNLSVNEALVTGEADEVQKNLGAELLSGSFVVSGEAYARLTRVGEDSYVSKLTLQAKAIKTGEQSEIIRSLNRLVKIAGIAIIPIGAMLFCHQYFLNHSPIESSVQGMAAAVLGMIPEGLFLLASVSLAISAIKLAKNQVLLHEMKSIETLARVDVLCVDKTGTITSPEMRVREVINLQNNRDNDAILSQFCSALRSDNETMKALKKYFKNPNDSELVLKTIGFSPKYKYSAAEFKSGRFVLGAPEFVLKEKFHTYQKEIQEHAKKGYRVLIFGQYKPALDGKELKEPVKPLSMVVLENPIRKTAPETFKYFREQGVAVKVISGDNPLTVSEVAKQAGIENAERFVDMSKLVTDQEIREAAEGYTVFGRVSPEQKRKLVKALQKHGHHVAMTGDGVNDVLALKDADCSIAMASGSDAAVHVAQVVLLESDFSKMPNVVREGRRVVNNLERSGSLFVVKNIFSVIAVILTLVLGVRYPMLPAQVSMLSVWTIGLPSFLLAQMPNEDLIRGRFLSNILSKAIPGGIVSAIVVFAAVGVCQLLNVPAEQTTSACTLAFATAAMVYLFRVCWPFNLYRSIIYAISLAGLAVCFIYLGWFFHFSDGLTPVTILTSISLGLLSAPLLIALTNKLKKPIDALAKRFSNKN